MVYTNIYFYIIVYTRIYYYNMTIYLYILAYASIYVYIPQLSNLEGDSRIRLPPEQTLAILVHVHFETEILVALEHRIFVNCLFHVSCIGPDEKLFVLWAWDRITLHRLWF